MMIFLNYAMKDIYITIKIEKIFLKRLIIEENNKLIGYLSYKIKDKATKSLWIDKFIIKKSYRNKGYGTKQINKIIEISKNENVNRIEFNCWPLNKNALKFYNKLNFKEQRIIYELEL